jgi:hypothetical protein
VRPKRPQQGAGPINEAQPRQIKSKNGRRNVAPANSTKEPLLLEVPFNQYGSILCISCESSMRLATIEPGEAGTSTATFECRYPPCARSRVMVIGKAELGQDVLST